MGPGAFVGLLLGLGLSASKQAAARPNVVVVLADDMGVDSVSALNPAMGLETPWLDRLAEQSCRFLDAHSPSAVCSPTRYALLTGRYSWRTRLKSGIVAKWGPPLIARERTTLPELMKTAGYTTACIGKWHLGWEWYDADGARTREPAQIDWGQRVSGGPLEHGFDLSVCDDVPNWPPFAWFDGDRLRAAPTDHQEAIPANGISAGPKTPGWEFEAVLPELTRRAVDWIEEQARRPEPFFLYFSMPSPHTPIVPAEGWKGLTGVSDYADFLVETDWSVGQLLQALERSGVAEDTLFLFTADNGTSPKCDFPGLEEAGVHLREHWRGHKADIFEGGHRVPFLLRWPGRADAGREIRVPITLTDVFATLAAAARVDVPEDAAEDSHDLVPLLDADPAPRWLQRPVVHHSSNGSFALRRGRWKAIFCPGSGGWSEPKGQNARDHFPPVQLYDMSVDPRETTNLHAEHPELVEELRAELRSMVQRGRSNDGPPGEGAGDHWSRLPWPKEG